MKKLLEKKFFPFVVKPGRYSAGESGEILKDSTNRTSFLFAYPDLYEKGQSDPCLCSTYLAINDDERFLCERVFQVDNDAGDILTKEMLSLFSVESYRPINQFDLIGFYLNSPLCYGNILSMLGLGNLPLLASERDINRLILIAFGSGTINPEPLSRFFDIFILGDFDRVILSVLDLMHQDNKLDKDELLRKLAKEINSIYIPSIAENSAASQFFVETAKSENLFRTNGNMIPLIDVEKNGLVVEFNDNYKSNNIPSAYQIAKELERQLKITGFENVFLGNSDNIEIVELVSSLSKFLVSNNIKLNLPVIKISDIKPSFLGVLRKLSFAPLHISLLSGSEKLRCFAGGDSHNNSYICRQIESLFKEKIKTINLHVEIGLPTETDEDIGCTINLLKNISDLGRSIVGNINLNVIIKPFTPDPNSVFQWDALFSNGEIKRKLKLYTDSKLLRPISFKYNPAEINQLPLLFMRGGNEVGEILLTAFQNGFVYDNDNELLNWDIWEKAIDESQFEFSEISSAISFSRKLPWHFTCHQKVVEGLISRRNKISKESAKFDKPKEEDSFQSNGESRLSFGRKTKKVAPKNIVAPTKNRLRIKWCKNNRYKYMSHLDNIRLMERVVRRADLPISFSGGNRPTMKFSLSAPLPLGFTSEVELLDMTLDSNVAVEMIDNLHKEMPQGTLIIENKIVSGKSGSLSASINRAVYSVKLEESENLSELQKKIKRILEDDKIEIIRAGKESLQTVDIKPGIFSLEIEDNRIKMTLGIGQELYVKPIEILQLLFEQEEFEYMKQKIHRLDLFRIDENGNKILAMDL